MSLLHSLSTSDCQAHIKRDVCSEPRSGCCTTEHMLGVTGICAVGCRAQSQNSFHYNVTPCMYHNTDSFSYLPGRPDGVVCFVENYFDENSECFRTESVSVENVSPCGDSFGAAEMRGVGDVGGGTEIVATMSTGAILPAEVRRVGYVGSETEEMKDVGDGTAEKEVEDVGGGTEIIATMSTRCSGAILPAEMRGVGDVGGGTEEMMGVKDVAGGTEELRGVKDVGGGTEEMGGMKDVVGGTAEMGSMKGVGGGTEEMRGVKDVGGGTEIAITMSTPAGGHTVGDDRYGVSNAGVGSRGSFDDEDDEDDDDDDSNFGTSMLQNKKKPRSRLKKFLTSFLSLSSSSSDEDNYDNRPAPSQPSNW